jgi:glutathione S-transferase
MLELYHHGSSTCASKVRFTLAEKQLAYTSHYVDLMKGEQFRPEYLRLNPLAVVPTLVHDGRVLTESTVICEYLDDAFPDPPLKPRSAMERARMRLWTKVVDEQLQPAAKYITYAACHRHILMRLPPEKFEQYMRGPEGGADNRVPGDPDWAKSKRAIVELGVAAPGVADKFRLYDRCLQRMEDALGDAAWLSGDTFSLADIALTPYVNRLDMLGMAELWTRSRPRLTDWFERIRARPTFTPCFPDFCPPDLTRDLNIYGSQAWPQVQRMLALA